MEVDSRKGFIYTLEAVIAASLMMGTVVFVIPEIQQTEPPTMEDLNSALVSLDGSDSLGNNTSGIEDDLQPYKPSNYNISVLTDSVETRDGSVDGDGQYYLEDGNKEVMLWIESASNLEITYSGSTVFDRSESGYHRFNVDPEPGYLNFTGTSDLDFRVNRFRSSGSLPASSEAYSTNYIDYKNSLREVTVILWR